MSISSEIIRLHSELPSTVKLVAVSKFKPVPDIVEAYSVGQRAFGESRPQEMMSKAMELPSDIQWHFIGHLQSNKIKMVVPFATMIESVHSAKLVKEIDSFAASIAKVMDCLLEVHIASEESKQGFTREELLKFSGHFGEFANIRFRGVMGMASNVQDPSQIHREFRSLKETFEAARAAGQSKSAIWVHHFDQISMGMSSDYKIAVEEGSTIVRIGSSIFGARV